jgi:NAD(P)-dependent dehydrogenase (short-subunit alcohol dehydrogenase family)
VVNDLGGSMSGRGSSAEPAAEVVEEIGEAGGVAVVDANDVSTAEGGRALIASAIERFGRIDALVNNAGIMRWADFPDVSAEEFERHLAVHLSGSFHTTRAAWPHMAERGYGRIVMTTSSGVFGLPNNTSYAAAKGGVIGLMRSLAQAGAPHGIKASCVAPAAYTRMAGKGDPPPAMAPELVAPMVAFLAHEDCPVSGEIYTAGFGRFARLFLASTEGVVVDQPTVEDVAEHWDAINAEPGYQVPDSLEAWSRAFTSHLDL